MTFSIIQDFIPPGRRNRPAHVMAPKFITIHDTANTRSGADAENHAKYLKSAAANLRGASWHFTVDGGTRDGKVAPKIYQHLPLTENGWHAGDGRNGPGNRKSIGIEICENSDGNRTRAEDAAAWLTAKLLNDFKLPLQAVRQHHDWSRKNCPRVLRGRNGGWAGFLAAVKNYMLEAGEPVNVGGTKIVGDALVTVTQAQSWARVRGAHQRFIDVASVYWRYGALTGIRPEVMYAQAAKETAFGRFGGAVTPDQNNWAGIKLARGGPCHVRESHQTFSTPEEGVRAHFNHMSAYVGLVPLGIPHPRYHVVAGLRWAGTIQTVEELSARWAPSSDYGQSVLNDFLVPMMKHKVTDAPEPTGLWVVQVGAFRNRKNAEEVQARLRVAGFEAVIRRRE
ncbi:MAG TPA: N-acetylmuramoyl-L-alanine amidase [Dissulfurispiraceae bacterium]|nr:N-acetylmuramoyl-L-alanine amidase [Dissulfurispiraceae bacterium]